MENSSRLLIIAAELFLTILLLTVAGVFFRGYLGVANEGLEEMSTVAQEAADQDLKSLATMTLSGYDVINNTKKYENSMNVTVDNLSQAAIYNSANRILNRDPLALTYVVPEDLYTCNLTFNENGVITQVTFRKLDTSISANSPEAQAMLGQLRSALSSCGVTSSSSFEECLAAIKDNVDVFNGPDASYTKSILANLVGVSDTNSWTEILDKTVERLEDLESASAGH